MGAQREPSVKLLSQLASACFAKLWGPRRRRLESQRTRPPLPHHPFPRPRPHAVAPAPPTNPVHEKGECILQAYGMRAPHKF